MTSATLAQPVTPVKRGRIAWAMYDWANSAVVTVVIAAVFPVFYNQVIAADLKGNAASAYSFTGAIALILSLLIAPFMGTFADVTAQRKRVLIAATSFGSLAVVALFSTQAGGWVWASLLFILIQVFLNISITMYDSLLSHVTSEEDQDRLSALGYALGYIGGGIHLALCTFIILKPDLFGIQNTETATRIALLSAGVWWFVFSIPLFRSVKEPRSKLDGLPVVGNTIQATITRLTETLRQLRGYRQLFLMLLAFWLYGDGIGTIIGLATTYGSQQLGLTSTTLIGALLLTQFVAFPYAMMFGRIPEKASTTRNFFVAFILWNVVSFPIMAIIAASSQYAGAVANPAALKRIGDALVPADSPTTTFIYLAINQIAGLAFAWFIGRRLFAPFTAQLNTKRTILLGLAVYSVIAVWGFFIYTPTEFWMLAWLVGTVQGGTQALSRSLFSSMTPIKKSGEFFGFYSLTDKFGSVFGLLLFGLVAALTGGNLRISILSVIVFFVLGGLLLTRVDVAAGQAAARAEDAA